MIQFAALLIDKALGGTVPLRFLSFALVGSFGVIVHLCVLTAAAACRGCRLSARRRPWPPRSP